MSAQQFFTEKRKKISVCVIFVLAVFLILFQFTDTPKVWLDEGVFTDTARNLAFHGVMGLQTEPGTVYPLSVLLSTGYPVIFPVAGSFLLFGVGIWQARLPMVIFMLILVIFFYFFVKKKYGFYSAILSVLLLLSFSPFYGNGRPVQGEVPGLVFLVLGLLCLLYFEQSFFQNKKWAILSGLFFGLSCATKPIYLAVLSGALIISLALWWKKIENKKVLWFFVLGFALPILLWFYTLFPTLRSMLSAVPTYLHLASNHDSSTPLIPTILANFLRFFKESTPLLFSFLSVTVLVSFFFRFHKKEDFRSNFSITESVILFSIILNWLSYLVGTGWYRYFFPASILLYLLFPSAILFLSQKVEKKIFRNLILIVPIILIMFQFYDLVFLSNTSFIVNRERNKGLATLLSTIEPNKTVFFNQTVEAIVFFKGENYSQYLTIGDFLEAGNKNGFATSSPDFILTSSGENVSFPLSDCYSQKTAAGFTLFQKREDCPK